MQPLSFLAWVGGITGLLSLLWLVVKHFLDRRDRQPRLRAEYRVLPKSLAVEPRPGTRDRTPGLHVCFPMWFENVGNVPPVPSALEFRVRGREWKRLTEVLTSQGVPLPSALDLKPCEGGDTRVRGHEIPPGPPLEESFEHFLALQSSEAPRAAIQHPAVPQELLEGVLADWHQWEVICHYGPGRHKVKAVPKDLPPSGP